MDSPVPRLSIVTPSYNAAATIEETLRSVRDQGIEGVEHIVVDGGSTDGTLDILAAAPGIRYISEPDRGLSHAVNKGIAMSRGDLVGWLNADDIFLPGALAAVLEARRGHPDAGWITGQCLIIDAQGREIRKAVTAYKNLLLSRYSFGLHLTQNFVSSASTFFARQALEEVGPLDETLRYAMDYDLHLRLATHGVPVVIQRPLAAFRMMEGTLSMVNFPAQFQEHSEIPRRHGRGHGVAIAVNSVASRLITGVYRGLAWRRSRLSPKQTAT